MEAFQTLIKRYGVDRETAFRVTQELDEEPKAMSKGLFQRYTLMRYVGMSPQEATDFLGRYYDA